MSHRADAHPAVAPPNEVKSSELVGCEFSDGPEELWYGLVWLLCGCASLTHRVWFHHRRTERNHDRAGPRPSGTSPEKKEHAMVRALAEPRTPLHPPHQSRVELYRSTTAA